MSAAPIRAIPPGAPKASGSPPLLRVLLNASLLPQADGDAELSLGRCGAPFGSTPQLNAAAPALLAAFSPHRPQPRLKRAKYQGERSHSFCSAGAAAGGQRWQSLNPPQQEEKQTHAHFVLCCSEKGPGTQICTEPSGAALALLHSQTRT